MKEREVAVAGARERAVPEVPKTIGWSLSSLLRHVEPANKVAPGKSSPIQYIDTARAFAH